MGKAALLRLYLYIPRHGERLSETGGEDLKLSVVNGANPGLERELWVHSSYQQPFPAKAGKELLEIAGQ